MKPTWLLTIEVDGAAGVEAARLRHLQGFHDHALAGKRSVAVDEDGQHRAPRASPRRSCRARTEPSTTGFTISRCEGLNASATCTLPPGVRRSDEKPLWYLTSPEPLSCVVSYLPSNSENSSDGALPSTLTSTFSRPRCAMPMTISSTPPRAATLDQVVEHRDQRSPPSSENRFCPRYLVCEIALEAFRHRQLAQDVQPFAWR